MKVIQIALLLSNIGLIFAETESVYVGWSPDRHEDPTQWKQEFPNTQSLYVDTKMHPDEVYSGMRHQFEEIINPKVLTADFGVNATFLGLTKKDLSTLFKSDCSAGTEYFQYLKLLTIEGIIELTSIVKEAKEAAEKPVKDTVERAVAEEAAKEAKENAEAAEGDAEAARKDFRGLGYLRKAGPDLLQAIHSVAETPVQKGTATA